MLGAQHVAPAPGTEQQAPAVPNEYLFSKTDSRVTIGPPSRGDVLLHTEAAGTAPPDAFGPFRVLHQVGAGTLGPVFRAYDADRARLVAVKVLRIDVPPERLHRLVAELERLIAAELAHPVVAAPIATGTDGLVIYLAQEYVPADSLDVVLRDEGPPVPADAIRVAAQLAGALDFAAAAKVFHGVLHPRDVLIAQDETRLTGLGVAAAIESIGVAAPRRRPYTAPERMAGAAWDRRADVFSLAALIHEMLWGRRLTAIGSEAAGGLKDLPGAHLARLKAAFARALAPDPADRFESAMDFATALMDAFPHVRIESRAVPAPQARLPLEPDLRTGLDGDAGSREGDAGSREGDAGSREGAAGSQEGDAGSAGLESRAPSDDRFSIGAGDGLPPSLEASAFANASADRRSFSEGWSADHRSLGGGGQTVPQHVPESDNLELHPAEDARYDEVEVAPAIGWNPEADAAEPPTVAAALPSGAGDGLRTARGEPDEPARSVMASVAAAMLVGLALGFAGGYTLGGRRGTPAVASAPAATAPSGPADVAAPPGREFTEAAVGDPDTVQPKPAPGERPDATSEKDTPRTAVAPVTAPGRLLVRSTPTGARVFVDGREQGQTPATIRELSPGTHRVRIAREGYVAEERRIVITTAQPIQSMTVDLRRTGAAATARSTGSPPPPPPATVGASVGALTVDSRPDGARVFLDGKLVGTTPLSLPQIAEGEHAVRLERDGYRRWSSSVRVAGGQRQRVAASLER